MISLDLNGNESPAEGYVADEHCKSGSPNFDRSLPKEVGLKIKPGETSTLTKPHPGIDIYSY